MGNGNIEGVSDLLLVDLEDLLLLRRRLLGSMAQLTLESSREDLMAIQLRVRKFWSLVHKASKLPENELFRMDTKKLFYDFEKTEEHRNFDKVRTHLHHQTYNYMVWKRKDNKRRYEEELREQRSSQEWKDRSAALTRRRRRRDAFKEARSALRDAILTGQEGPVLGLLWVEAEEAYNAVLSVRVPNFQGDGFGAPWVEVRAALLQSS